MGPPPPPPRRRRGFFGGFFRRPFFGGRYGGGWGSGCLIPFVIIILAVFVIVTAVSSCGRGAFGGGRSGSNSGYVYEEHAEEPVASGSSSSSSGSSAAATSTKTRKKADTGLSFSSDCVKDELGWVESPSATGQNLETFYTDTGVQPYVYLKAYDSTLTSDSEKEEYAENWYDENIDNEGTFLYIYFAEEDAEEEVGYMYCVDGYEIASVMDEEAIDIFWDYVNEYWYSDLSMDDMLVKVFDSTAEAIM